MASAWVNVQEGPQDPILGTNERFKADTDPRKVNLGIGAYRDDRGKPYVLPSVLLAEEMLLAQKQDKEYLPIVGLPDFTRLAAELAFGSDSKPLLDNRICCTQTLSGTGALRIAADFIARCSGTTTIYAPTPTYGNHEPILRAAQVQVAYYRYYDPSTCGLDAEGMLEDLEAIPDRSAILVHACAHNPTGVDPSQADWDRVVEVAVRKRLLVLVDMAYQGFASGDPDKDAYALRALVAAGVQILCAQSFAKNLGMYGERIGMLAIVAESIEEKKRIESQIKIIIRANYSSPPLHGAQIVALVLRTPKLRQMWLDEVKGMADRIIKMRHLIVDGLKQIGSPRDWSHIVQQIGMFCYSGITPEQVDRLEHEFHVYCTRDGRMSIAGINESNVGHVVQSIFQVTKESN